MAYLLRLAKLGDGREGGSSSCLMKFVCYTDWEQLPATADRLFALAEEPVLLAPLV